MVGEGGSVGERCIGLEIGWEKGWGKRCIWHGDGLGRKKGLAEGKRGGRKVGEGEGFGDVDWLGGIRIWCGRWVGELEGLGKGEVLRGAWIGEMGMGTGGVWGWNCVGGGSVKRAGVEDGLGRDIIGLETWIGGDGLGQGDVYGEGDQLLEGDRFLLENW